jgi:hypothetical protein
MARRKARSCTAYGKHKASSLKLCYETPIRTRGRGRKRRAHLKMRPCTKSRRAKIAAYFSKRCRRGRR